MKRLTSAQKARRQGRNPRGGKTRQQILREKINSHQQYLRENDLSDPKFSFTPIKAHISGHSHRDANDYAIYGIYKDGSQWVLTGLSATDDYERMSRDRTKYSEMKVRGRYVLVPGHGPEIDPELGVDIKRFDTKKEALKYVSADGSNRVEPGKYLICLKHNPRSRREEVDSGEFQQFKHNARKVWQR